MAKKVLLTLVLIFFQSFLWGIPLSAKNNNYSTVKINTNHLNPLALNSTQFSNKTVEYDGTVQSITATNIPPNITVIYAPTNLIDAGVYKITATFYENGKEVDKKTATLTIEKTTFSRTVIFKKKTVTYDGTEQIIEVEGTLPPNTTAVYENNKHTDVGDYRAKVTLEGINYKKSIRYNNLVIKKAAIKDIQFNTKSYTYDGKVKSLAITGNLPLGTTVTYTNNNQSTIGNYQVTATIDGGNNYESTSFTAILKIVDHEVEIPSIENVIFKDKTVSYDGTPHRIMATNIPADVEVIYETYAYTDAGVYTMITKFIFEGQVLGTKKAILTIEAIPFHSMVKFEGKIVTYNNKDHELKVTGKLPEDISIDYTNNKHKLVGSYKVEAKLQAKNYITQILYSDLVINKAELNKLTLNSQTFIYDGASKSLAVSGKVPEDVVINYTNNTQYKIGSYPITATIDGGNNYYDTTLNAILTISTTGAPLPSLDTVVYDDRIVRYNGSIQSIEATNLPTGVHVTYSPNNLQDAGEYIVTASFTYNNQEIGIRKAMLHIEQIPFDSSIQLKKKLVYYNGQEQELLLVGALPEGTTAIYTNNKHKDTGTYEVDVVLSGKNYLTTHKTNLFIINRTQVSGLLFKNKTFIYDGQVKDLKVEGTIPNEVNITYNNNNQTNIGTYNVTAQIAGGKNYYDTTLKATLTIVKDPNLPDLDLVKFENTSVTFDNQPHNIIATNIPANTSVSYDLEDLINAGNYTIKATFTYNGRVIGTKTAVLTIRQAKITGIQLLQKRVVYNEKEYELTITGTLPTGVIVTYLTPNKFTNVGIYTVDVTLSGNNYITEKLTNQLIIEKATIKEITFIDGSFEYDGTAKALTITGNLPDGATVAYTNNKQTEVGTYKVTATVDGGNNYNNLVLNANLTITKTTIKGITFIDGSFEYDGKAKALAITGNLPDGTTVTYTNNKQTEVGTYKVTATIDGGKNYSNLVLQANLTIAKTALNTDNSIEVLKIGETTYNKPKDVIQYNIDCNNNASYLIIEIVKLPKGATAIQGNSMRVDLTKAGTKFIELQIKAEDGQIKKYTIKVVKSINASLVVIQKFNNVLLANNNSNTNGGYNFSAYKWFKNGQLISEKQFYSVGETAKDQLDPNAVYTVELTTNTGEVITSCPIEIKINRSKAITMYPNPVDKNVGFNLDFDYDTDEFTGAHLAIISITGQLIHEQQIENVKNNIQLPNISIASGKYIAVIKTAKETKSIQFIIK
jgi:hypothetical protein